MLAVWPQPLHDVAPKRLLHTHAALAGVEADLVVAPRLRDDDEAVRVAAGEAHQAAASVLVRQLVLRKRPLGGEVLGQRDGNIALQVQVQAQGQHNEKHSVTQRSTAQHDMSVDVCVVLKTASSTAAPATGDSAATP